MISTILSVNRIELVHQIIYIILNLELQHLNINTAIIFRFVKKYFIRTLFTSNIYYAPYI